MKAAIRAAALVLLLCSDAVNAGGCSTFPESNVGCEFYAVTLPNPLLDQTTYNFAIEVRNVDDSPVDVTVTGGGLMAPELRNIPVGESTRITLPWVAAVSQSTATVIAAGGAYRISATGQIAVVQFNSADPGSGVTASGTNDGSLLYPVSFAGKQYTALSWPTLNLGGTQLPGNVGIVATDDGTTVQIVAAATLQPGAGLDASGGTVQLDRGDILILASAHNAPIDSSGADLSGTKISSNHPVLAWSGHAMARVPIGVNFADHLEESLPPRSAWSSEHLVVRPGAPDGMPSSARHVVRILADGPVSLTSDPSVPGLPTALGAGAVAELEALIDFRLSSTGPILVASFMVGSDRFNGSGDPGMVFVVPLEFAQREIMFVAPLEMGQGFADIVAPTGSVIVLDGVQVSDWTAVGNSGYSVAREALCCTDTHLATGTQPFTLTVYSYPDSSSYYYPAAIRVEEVVFRDGYE